MTANPSNDPAMNIKKVAALAGVSTATVSRTINGSPLVSPATAEKVWHTIHRLGYFPNTQARALVSGHSRILGLIISDITNPFFPELVKSFEQAAIAGGYEVIVANTDYESSRMSLCVRRMIERQVDGVAIMTSELEHHLLEQLALRQSPIVFLDHEQLPLVNRVCDISVDYAGGIRMAVEHLLALGHLRMGFISGPQDLSSARTRRHAFLECLAEHGLTGRESYIVEGDHKVEGGYRAMHSLLQLSERPTAVLASNDLTALGALRALADEGVSVPEEMSLIGFDDIQISGYMQPPLTTIRLSREELGRKAFELLASALREEFPVGRRLYQGTNLVVRGTTAAPRH
jgi:LacI family transcriptional regulator